MATLHSDKWGKIFSEILTALLTDIRDGRADALSRFMEDEKRRVLGDVGMLLLPEAPPPK